MNTFVYTIEQLGTYIVIKDARDLHVVINYNKISPNFNISEDLIRTVFSVQKTLVEIDIKSLKKGVIKLFNTLTGETFKIKFIDANGNNILTDVVLSFLSNDAGTASPAPATAVAEASAKSVDTGKQAGIKGTTNPKDNTIANSEMLNNIIEFFTK